MAKATGLFALLGPGDAQRSARAGARVIRHEVRKGIESHPEFHRGHPPDRADNRRGERGGKQHLLRLKLLWRAFHRARHDVVRFGLSLQPDRQAREQRDPPHDEIDGKHRKQGHGHTSVGQGRAHTGRFPLSL